MNGDVLIQNIINIFVMSIILESAVMAVFSLGSFKGIDSTRPFEASRDLIIVAVSFFLCYKVELLKIFNGTGIEMPKILDTIISALVLARMTNFIRQITERLKNRD